jgi:small-conductance mechanosensitive channel
MLAVDLLLFSVAAGMLVGGLLPKLRAYRALFIGGFLLFLSVAVYLARAAPWEHATLPAAGGGDNLAAKIFGVAWWLLGAWLARRVLTLVLSRTLFPNDNLPHARRLFADLASVLIYVIAFIGILYTVIKEPLSAVLATSGVLAIVLGLALQNTLGDVFSGLSINIEQPFGAGDWITLLDHVEGQIIEINWRATRIKTAANDIVVIPNSVIAKAVVTTHRRLHEPYRCVLRLKIDSRHSPPEVGVVLLTAAAGAAGVSAGSTAVYATAVTDGGIAYEVWFGVGDFADGSIVQSGVIAAVAEACRHGGYRFASDTLDVRVVSAPSAAVG